MPCKQAANGAGKADVHLSDAQLGVAVDALVGEINVVDADDFAAVGIDDLLVEQVFAQRRAKLRSDGRARAPTRRW